MMDLATTMRLRFPDPAGVMQASGTTAALIRELGDNYDRYHRFPATRLSDLGGRPEPSAYTGDLAGYMRTFADVQEVVSAEMLLRRARAFRKLGASLSENPDPSLPLVDAEHRLISADLGAPTPDAKSVPAARAWKPLDLDFDGWTAK